MLFLSVTLDLTVVVWGVFLACFILFYIYIYIYIFPFHSNSSSLPFLSLQLRYLRFSLSLGSYESPTISQHFTSYSQQIGQSGSICTWILPSYRISSTVFPAFLFLLTERERKREGKGDPFGYFEFLGSCMFSFPFFSFQLRHARRCHSSAENDNRGENEMMMMRSRMSKIERMARLKVIDTK